MKWLPSTHRQEIIKMKCIQDLGLENKIKVSLKGIRQNYYIIFQWFYLTHNI